MRNKESESENVTLLESKINLLISDQ